MTPEEIHWLGMQKFYGEPAWTLAERHYGLKPGTLARFTEHWLVWASIWTHAENRLQELNNPKTTKY